MSVENWLTIAGVAGSVIGFAGALLNRRRIVVHRLADSPSPGQTQKKGFPTVRKRLKRLLLSIGAVFVWPVLIYFVISLFADPDSLPEDSRTGVGLVVMIPMLLAALMAVYQFAAMVLVLCYRAWK